MVNHQKRLLGALVVCIILGGVIYYYSQIKVPSEVKKAENNIRLEIDDAAIEKKVVAIVADQEGISKYTVLTHELISQKIKLISIPKRYCAEGVVMTLEQLLDKVAKEDLRPGEQIVSESLTTTKKWYNEDERLMEYEIETLVAGEVKTGNIVDVVVDYGNGTYDNVVSKIKVHKLVGQEGAEISDINTSVQAENTNVEAQPMIKTNSSQSNTLLFAVNEENYRDLLLAETLGKLRVRLYLDENQPASQKTFDYQVMLQKTNQETISGTSIQGENQ